MFVILKTLKSFEDNGTQMYLLSRLNHSRRYLSGVQLSYRCYSVRFETEAE